MTRSVGPYSSSITKSEPDPKREKLPSILSTSTHVSWKNRSSSCLLFSKYGNRVPHREIDEPLACQTHRREAARFSRRFQSCSAACESAVAGRVNRPPGTRENQ